MFNFRGKPNKNYLLFLIPTLIIFAIYFFYKLNSNFRYFIVECSVYNRDSKLIYSLPDHSRCIFNADGTVLASRISKDEISLFDKNDNVIWAAQNMSVHHDMNITGKDDQYLVLTSKNIKINDYNTRSDCVSVINRDNKILKKWCVADHLEEMAKLGLNSSTVSDVPFYNPLLNQKLVKEISHFNSVYEIKKNKRSDVHPAFAEGNYIINDWGPANAIFILDKEMKKVLWFKKYNYFKMGSQLFNIRTHDAQMTEDGNILFYVNSIIPSSIELYKCRKQFFNKILNEQQAALKYSKIKYNPLPHSRLMEFDPLTNEIKWQFFAEPKESFYSFILGSVTRLKNSNYLFSEIKKGGRAFEITESGKAVWQFENPVKNNSGEPLPFQSIRPMYDLTFLKSRKLMD